MTMTASRLRADIYRILDEVLETGKPAVIERRGRTLRIVPDERPSRLAALEPRPSYLKADPRDLVHLDWSAEWRP
jgi:hypothetical protein